MKKEDLDKAVAEKMGVSKVMGTSAVNAVIEAIADALVAGDKVPLPGLGTLKVVTQKACARRNLHTGEMISVPAKNRVKWLTAVSLKKSLND